VAEYHCHVQAISRAPTPKAPKGRSAVAAAAYRSGDKLHDEHSTRAEAQPITHDYTRRSGVVHAEIVLPEAAPDWARDRQQLWNKAEAADTRKNSTLAREFEAGLPWELSDVHRVELARAITRALVERYGFAADFAVHRPNAAKGDDPRNHHVHILCSTRVIAADGFAEKTRVLDSAKTGADEIRWAREMVARLSNEALARAGIDASVDHRSLVDQRAAALADGDDERAEALDRPATKHRGPIVEAITRDGRESDVEERITSELVDEIAEIGRRLAAETAVAREIEALDTGAGALKLQLAVVEFDLARALQEIADETPPAPDPAPGPFGPGGFPKGPPEPKPEPKPPSTPIIYTPPPTALVPIEELERDLLEAERLLARAEALAAQREQARRQALQRAEQAKRAVEEAQGGLWARMRAALGFSPPAAVVVAQRTAREASAAAVALMQDQRQAAGLAPARAGFLGRVDAVALAAELTAGGRQSIGALAARVSELREQLGGLRAEDAEKRRQEVAAVAEVVALVVRLDAVVPPSDPGRTAWRTLAAIDKHHLIDSAAADPYARLAVVLTQQPQVRQQIVAEIASRLPELVAIEARSRTDSGLADAPESIPDSHRGLLAVIECGPKKAWPGHFEAYFQGCERRGEITADERDQVAEILQQLPGAPLLRDELLHLVDQVQDDDQAGPAPGM
jgi:hypothetical protein